MGISNYQHFSAQSEPRGEARGVVPRLTRCNSYLASVMAPNSFGALSISRVNMFDFLAGLAQPGREGSPPIRWFTSMICSSALVILICTHCESDALQIIKETSQECRGKRFSVSLWLLERALRRLTPAAVIKSSVWTWRWTASWLLDKVVRSPSWHRKAELSIELYTVTRIWMGPSA